MPKSITEKTFIKLTVPKSSQMDHPYYSEKHFPLTRNFQCGTGKNSTVPNKLKARNAFSRN